MNDNHIPCRNEQFRIRQFNNELLLYSEEQSEALFLNSTGLIIFSMCDCRKTVGQIINELENAYPDHKGFIRGDVIESLKMLNENKVLFFTASEKNKINV